MTAEQSARDDIEALADVLLEHSALGFYMAHAAPDGAGWYCSCGAKVAGDVRWDVLRLPRHQADVLLGWLEGVRAAERERLAREKHAAWLERKSVGDWD